MDVFSDILTSVKLLGSLYFTTDFSPPWGIRVPAYRRVARFHIVLRGRCWVDTPDGAGPECLERGDIVLIPHGATHTLADSATTECEEVEAVVQARSFTGLGPLVIEGGTEESPARLLCGHFEFDESVEHPLLTGLPSRIVMRGGERGSAAELDDLIRLITREVQHPRAGQAAAIRRFSEILFIQSVRAWADTDGPRPGILDALSDPALRRSLLAVHERFAERWSLPLLAREAGLSRTVFAERFRGRVGMPPMHYLAFWRMQKARELFAVGSPTVEFVAEAVGYGSLPSFSRAFKRWVGTPPGSYRRGS